MLPKSALLTLLNRYPTPKDLFLALRDRQEGPPPASAAATPPAVVTPPPQPAPAREPPPPAPKEPSTAPPAEQSQAITVFAVVSPNFARPTLRPPDSTVPPPPTVPARPAEQVVPPPTTSSRPDPASAYQPVHAACVALLQAIEQLSTYYGREWLQWEQAQVDLAQLRAVVASDDDMSRFQEC